MSDTETTFGSGLDGRDPDGSLSDDRQPGEAEGAVHLRRSINALNGTLQGLLDSTERMASKEYVEEWQKDQERKRKRFTLAMVLGGIISLVMLVGLGITMLKVYDIAASTEENTQTVIDCTAPSIDPDSCYYERRKIQEESQRAETEKIITEITNTIAEKVGNRVEKILRELAQQ